MGGTSLRLGRWAGHVGVVAWGPIIHPHAEVGIELLGSISYHSVVDNWLPPCSRSSTVHRNFFYLDRT